MQHNYHPAGVTTLGAFTPDNLIAPGPIPLNSEGITLKSGANYVRGTVLEETVFGTATRAAKSGGNTGNGTLTLDATTPTLYGAEPGVYTVRLVTAAANGGTFRVTAPNGVVLGDVAVGATFSNRVKFATADGSTDFIVGDGFDITVAAVAASAQKYQKVTEDARAKLVLLEDVDATSADQAAVAANTGNFNKSALSIGSTATLAGVERTLARLNIYLRDTVAIVTVD
jgi:hypothetical protein